MSNTANSPGRGGIEGKGESMCLTQIKAKFIPDTRILKIVLDKKLGEGQFHVEMRQNIYTIRSHQPLDKADLLAAVEQQELPPEKPRKWYQFGKR